MKWASRVKNLPLGELKRQAKGLCPFLFDEKEADLLIRAHELVPSMLERYHSSFKL